MTTANRPCNPLQLAEQASLIGKEYCVRCLYKQYNGTFQWRYYRRGLWIGSTTKPEEVVRKMMRYCGLQNKKTRH